MTPRALGTGPALGLVALLCLGGCGEPSPAEQREDYCALVGERGEQLTRIADEGGAAGFVDALPVLTELRAEAPADLRDEWGTFVDALEGLRDALEASGVDPADAGPDGLPEGLDRDARRRIRGAASVLARDEVVAATQGIEQHALDVCGTPLL